MADHEVWKSIPGHKGYEASNLGRVRSLDRWVAHGDSSHGFFRRGLVLRQFTLRNGYKTTHLGKDTQHRYVHRLVALAFFGEIPKGMEVCHNNGIKGDNRLENLRLDTRSANMRDVAKNRYEQAWLNQDAKNSEKTRRAKRMA